VQKCITLLDSVLSQFIPVGNLTNFYCQVLLFIIAVPSYFCAFPKNFVPMSHFCHTLYMLFQCYSKSQLVVRGMCPPC
jgi:hypothetical protein